MRSSPELSDSSRELLVAPRFPSSCGDVPSVGGVVADERWLAGCIREHVLQCLRDCSAVSSALLLVADSAHTCPAMVGSVATRPLLLVNSHTCSSASPSPPVTATKPQPAFALGVPGLSADPSV